MAIWRSDWVAFAEDAMGVRLDKEQANILHAIQHHKRVSVASGTARGKDFVAAVAAMCFFILTPKVQRTRNGMAMVENTKIAMTAPTDRQVRNIMIPEISRLFHNIQQRFPDRPLPARLLSDGLRTDYTEWFLTGFKADDSNTEAWSGFHAVNTMFIVTEASGISESTYNAIEGNLQGNSRLLLVFNPNTTTGYAARAMKSDRFVKFRLNSLNAENVVKKRLVIPGQVDYEWVKDKVENWCVPIMRQEFNEGEGDFVWEGGIYRPNDLFRVKVLGMFPRVAEDVLIPYEWIELANENWRAMQESGIKLKGDCRIGVDVAGMGRDSNVLCFRYGSCVERFEVYQSKGRAEHMHVAGMVAQHLQRKSGSGRTKTKVFIDTIGEGAGVFSRLQEQGYKDVYSCKFSESAKNLHDITGEYTFANMRAYLFWAVRDWLNPKNNFSPALPPNNRLMEEATDIHWKFLSSGSIMIEAKEDIKKRVGRSTDLFDALANTFYPYDYDMMRDEDVLKNLL